MFSQKFLSETLILKSICVSQSLIPSSIDDFAVAGVNLMERESSPYDIQCIEPLQLSHTYYYTHIKHFYCYKYKPVNVLMY